MFFWVATLLVRDLKVVSQRPLHGGHTGPPRDRKSEPTSAYKVTRGIQKDITPNSELYERAKLKLFISPSCSALECHKLSSFVQRCGFSAFPNGKVKTAKCGAFEYINSQSPKIQRICCCNPWFLQGCVGSWSKTLVQRHGSGRPLLLYALPASPAEWWSSGNLHRRIHVFHQTQPREILHKISFLNIYWIIQVISNPSH